MGVRSGDSIHATPDTLSGSLDFLFNATGSNAGDQGLMLGEQTGGHWQDAEFPHCC